MRTRVRDPFAMERMERHEQNLLGNNQRERVRDQSYIKQYNIQAVLSMLKRWQPVSRTDISRLTSMSPTSITRIVSALLNQNLIYETTGDQRSGRGRKATNLRINDEGLFAVGIHLDKSVIRLCVTDMADQTLYRGEMLVDGECTPERMAAEARNLFDRMPEDIVRDRSRIGAVGVCLAGAVNHWNGIVSRSDQMGWQNVDVRAAFSEAFGMTASVENDVKACLVGEKTRMGIPDETDTAYLLVGSGIGTAITCGGTLMRGERNQAGEIARIPMLNEKPGEDFLSAHMVETHLVRRAQKYDPSVHTLDAILWAQKQGQQWAEDMMVGFKEHLTMVIAMIEKLCDPAQIILGGDTFRKVLPQIEDILEDPRICLGSRYEESCMTGAALIAMRSAITELIGQSIE